MIQERINKLKPYFKGLKVAENYRIVEFSLKNSWVVEESPGIELQQKNIKENGNVLYSMFYSDKKSFDEIIEFVEEKVIRHNLELEEKERLLRAKVEELKRVFENKDLNELNNLKFTTEDNALKLGSKKPTPPTKMVREGENPNKPEYLKGINNKDKQNGHTKELSEQS